MEIVPHLSVCPSLITRPAEDSSGQPSARVSWPGHVLGSISDNVLRVPTWPNHTSVPGTHLRAYNSTAQATDTLQGHVSLERAKRAEAAPVCYTPFSIQKSPGLYHEHSVAPPLNDEAMPERLAINRLVHP